MRTKLTVAALAAFGLVLASGPAFAREARVNIPFAFTAMGKTLPAGAYEVTEQTPDVLRLESVTSPAVQVELPVLERLSPGQTPGNAKVVFDETGNASRLAQVWIDGDDGYVVALSAR